PPLHASESVFHSTQETPTQDDRYNGSRRWNKRNRGSSARGSRSVARNDGVDSPFSSRSNSRRCAPTGLRPPDSHSSTVFSATHRTRANSSRVKFNSFRIFRIRVAENLGIFPPPSIPKVTATRGRRLMKRRLPLR